MTPSLPIDAVLPEVVATLRDAPAVVVHAPTGAGKTTALPGALLDAGLAGDGAIWVLEPRRIAARAAARHVARLRGGRPGDEVGWHVRFDPRFGAATRLLYLTDGTAVRRLQSDPFLEGVGIVVFDEFHERALPTDLALAMVRRVQREIRDDLRVVVMSATLDATRVAAFLDDAPIVRSEGRSFPVDVRYLSHEDDRHVIDVTADGVRRALTEASGDVLAFLPGAGEIAGVTEALGGLDGVDLLPLHGRLPPEQQDRALRTGPRRRVVLATNVAETSLTLDGIEAVVDSGLARILRHDPGSGLDRLVLEPISRASADQRAGRAGRQAPGIAWRLWSGRAHAQRPAHDTPALQRTDLAGPVLQLRAFGEPDPAAFPWVEPPPPAALASAESLLLDLGLVAGGRLTRRGQAAAALPVHPRLAVLLLEAAGAGHPGPGALAAAVLAERDPFRRHRPHDGPVDATESDVLDRVHAIRTGRDPRLVHAARDRIRQVADRLRQLARDAPTTDRIANGDEAVLRAIAIAWADRIALRREDGTRGRMVGGRGVRLEGSGVRDGALFACVQADDAQAREARVRIASHVDPAWLDLEDRVDVGFDVERRQVVARSVRAYRDLVLDAHPAPLPEPGRVSACLEANVVPESLPWDQDPVATLLARLHHASAVLPDLPTPDAAFRASLVPDLCIGRRGLDELTPARLADAVRNRLGWAGAQALDREAPERLEVPSGSRIHLQWSTEGPPVLAVRMQEMFGLTETPRVLRGRLAVRLHLLAPNMRPAQITEDLASFWANGWPEVRKEMRARYPKHAWPEDPVSAEPMRGARRRR